MFSDSAENNCTKAHSSEELQEWNERHKYRKMKIRKAKEQKLYAFMDEVLMKYNFRTRGVEVVSQSILLHDVNASIFYIRTKRYVSKLT